MDLSPEQKDEIVAQLSPGLQEKYQAQRPVILSPSMVESQGQAGEAKFVRVPSGKRVELNGILVAEFEESGRCIDFKEWRQRHENDHENNSPG